MDYYLRANTEAELWSKLTEVGVAKPVHVKDKDGAIVRTEYDVIEKFSIDVIGTIHVPTGNLIQQSLPDSDRVVEVPETVALEGYHANLRGPADLAPTVEYIEYVPTEEDKANTEFVMPFPERRETPSPLSDILVNPGNPVRKWF